MIGRAAIGDPWVFRHFAKTSPPALFERIDVALDHYHLLRKLRPERAAVPEFRKYLGSYLSGFRRAKEWRMRLMQCKTETAFLAEMTTLRKYAEPLPDSLPLAS
jgi:tRNA-dihydrouridine synthase B